MTDNEKALIKETMQSMVAIMQEQQQTIEKMVNDINKLFEVANLHQEYIENMTSFLHSISNMSDDGK